MAITVLVRREGKTMTRSPLLTTPEAIAPGKAAVIQIRAQHVLHRITEVLVVPIAGDGHALQVLEQRVPVVPRQSRCCGAPRCRP